VCILCKVLPKFEDANLRILVFGKDGMVGSALGRALTEEKAIQTFLVGRSDCDLSVFDSVSATIHSIKPEIVICAAARVGGILANQSCPAEFITDNLIIQTNVTRACHLNGVGKMIFLGSSCIYPSNIAGLIREEQILTGPLEETNIAYAMAKLSGVVACRSYNAQYGTSFVTVMPCNLYGPNDNFDLETSHVFPALVRKFAEAIVNRADMLEVWGTGIARREFLHVDDLASACILICKRFSELKYDLFNVGYGSDVPISWLVERLVEISGFKGKICFDKTKPDGVRRKLMDISRIQKLGWSHVISLEDGLADSYHTYLNFLREKF
jgi:GDP-L-fucose synthase